LRTKQKEAVVVAMTRLLFLHHQFDGHIAAIAIALAAAMAMAMPVPAPAWMGGTHTLTCRDGTHAAILAILAVLAVAVAASSSTRIMRCGFNTTSWDQQSTEQQLL
jgi:hypothetical protein